MVNYSSKVGGKGGRNQHGQVADYKEKINNFLAVRLKVFIVFCLRGGTRTRFKGNPGMLEDTAVRGGRRIRGWEAAEGNEDGRGKNGSRRLVLSSDQRLKGTDRNGRPENPEWESGLVTIRGAVLQHTGAKLVAEHCLGRRCVKN